jgi:hypothetical protein
MKVVIIYDYLLTAIKNLLRTDGSMFCRWSCTDDLSRTDDSMPLELQEALTAQLDATELLK